MNPLLSLLILLVAALFCFPPDSYAAVPEKEDWQLLAKNKWCSVEVEKRLYKKAGDADLFARVRTSNIGNKSVGFLFPYRLMFHICDVFQGDNKDAIYNLDYRTVHRPLPSNEELELLKSAFAKGTNNMQVLQPGQSLEYYVGYWDQKKYSHKFKYSILMMDGYLPLTDGSELLVLQTELAPSAEKIAKDPYNSPFYWTPIMITRTQPYVALPAGARCFGGNGKSSF